VAEKVGGHYVIKLHLYNQSAFVGILINFMHRINAKNMQHIKVLTLYLRRSKIRKKTRLEFQILQLTTHSQIGVPWHHITI